MNLRNLSPLGFAALCLVLVLAGIAIIAYWPENLWPGHRTMEAVAHALIIAGVLSLTVDWFVKDRLLHEVSKDTSSYLIGYGLPPELQGRIRELMSSGLVRTQFNLHYELTVADGIETLKITVSYVLENVSGQPQEFAPSLVNEHPYFIKMSLDGPTVFLLNETELKQRIERQDGQVSVRADRISLNPSRPGAKPYRYEHCYTMRPQDSHDIFVFGRPTIAVTVHFDVPTGYVVRNQSLSKPKEEPPNEWFHDRAFLPGEHLNYRWFKDQGPGTTHAEQKRGAGA